MVRSIPYYGDISDIKNPKGGLIKINNLTKMENELVSYMIKNISLNAETPEEEDLIEECREAGLRLTVIPRLTKTKFSRVGHAISTFLSEKCFNLDIPILPWAIPLALDQDLPNYDALCFDQSQNIWILEAKTSQTSTGLTSSISQLTSHIKKEGIHYFIRKALWYQKHYSDKIKLFPVLKVLKELHDGNSNKMNIIGFFIAPNVTKLIGRYFERDLDEIVSSFRRNVDYDKIVQSSEKIYRRIGEAV